MKKLKPKESFRILRIKGEIEGYLAVVDGQRICYIALERTLEDYREEYLNGCNEMAQSIGQIETAKHNHYVLWTDTETQEIFITKTV